jgi:hypothetical protein
VVQGSTTSPLKTCGDDDDILFTFYVNPQILLKTHIFLFNLYGTHLIHNTITLCY